MTAAREDTRPARAVVVGADRPGAAQVFGAAFERVLTTTYDEMAADLAEERSASAEAGVEPGPVAFVGVAAGRGMEPAVDAALGLLAEAGATAGLEVAVEIPWDLDALDHLRRRLTEAGAPPVSDVRRYRDRPCLVLGGPPAATDDAAWFVSALLTAGTTVPDVRVAEQDRVAADWERASAQALLERKDAELQRLRATLRRSKGERRQGRKAGRGHGRAPAPGTVPAGRRASVGRVLAAVGRRAGGTGAVGGAVALAVLVVVLFAVPALLLGLVADEAGVVVGLALGATLLACALLAGVVLVAQRRTAARLDQLQRTLADQGRAVGRQGQQQRQADRRLGRALAEQTETLDDVRARVRGLRGRVRDMTRREGLTTRRQLQAVVNLAGLVPLRAGLPPLGSWAASPDFALEVVDRLLVERPRLVVEAGSGASTLLLALAAREHGLDTRIVSLDHDAHFAAETRALLERHGVADRAEVRWAPLARTHVPDHLTPWYDEEALTDLHDIGLLVVDGPPAATGPAARYPAVPLLQERLAPRCTIVVDDTARADDREVVDRWARLLPDFERSDLPLEKGASVLRRG